MRFVQENEDFLTETQLAAQLGISRKSLWERRQRLNIPRKKTQQRGLREQSLKTRAQIFRRKSTKAPKPNRVREHAIRKQISDANALTVIEVLNANGFQAYLVGGCARDTLWRQTERL